MKIIVLKTTPYKVKDGLVDVITQEGKKCLLAKGILEPKNHLAAISDILSVADVSFVEGDYKFPIIRSAKLVSTPRKINEDLDYVGSLMLASELVGIMVNDEDGKCVFNELLLFINSIKTSTNPLMCLLIFLFRLLQLTGYGIDTSSCLCCGSKSNIVGFSFVDGGFLCKNCADENTKLDLNNEQLLLIRSASMAKDYNFVSKCYSVSNVKIILNKFFEFIFDAYGAKPICAGLLDN